VVFCPISYQFHSPVCLNFYFVQVHAGSQHSVVGIVTHHGLDGLGSNRSKIKTFSTHPDQPWGPPSLLYNGYWVILPGVKQLGHGINHPRPSSTKVKERVELYLYSPSVPSWQVIGWVLPVPQLYAAIITEHRLTINFQNASITFYVPYKDQVVFRLDYVIFLVTVIIIIFA